MASPRSTMVLVNALVAWLVSSGMVWLGAWFGIRMCWPQRPWAEPLMYSLCRIDGVHYANIARDGYFYDPEVPSDVAFFPLFPILISIARSISGLSYPACGVLVANVAGLASAVLFALYLRRRKDGQPPSEGGDDNIRSKTSEIAVLAYCFAPAAFYMRMAYTESLFLLLAMLVFIGATSRWPTLVLAVLVGAATATRPVGIALCIPLAASLTVRFASPLSVLRAVGVMCVGTSGLLAFMAFQWAKFGTPFAFASNQAQHSLRGPATAADKYLSLLSLEPITNAYSPSAVGYWQSLDWVPTFWFSLSFANPLLMCTTFALLVFGFHKKWINRVEFSYSVAVLLMGYALRGYDTCMNSQARFASVAFPVAIVAGCILYRLTETMRFCVLAACGLYAALFAAMFAAGYNMP